MAMRDMIAAYDEVYMAKLRLRLAGDTERVPTNVLHIIPKGELESRHQTLVSIHITPSETAVASVLIKREIIC